VSRYDGWKASVRENAKRAKRDAARVTREEPDCGGWGLVIGRAGGRKQSGGRR